MSARLDDELVALLASVPAEPGHAAGLAGLRAELDERGDFDGLEDGLDAEEVW
jgi:hypothetical protein